MATYRGYPDVGDPKKSVRVDGKTLPVYLEEVNHSPSGFGWGYRGAGPAQLAYAIVRHHTGSREIAGAAEWSFRDELIAPLSPDSPWELTSEQVEGSNALREATVRTVMND